MHTEILLPSHAPPKFSDRSILWNSVEKIEKAEVWRKAWADVTNRYLAEQNRPERIDHRSYVRQGIDKIPTVHMGVAVTQMERRGIVTERGEQNREIRKQNRLLTEMRRQISRLTVWIRQMTGQEREHPSINLTQSNQNQSFTLLDYLNRAMQESNVPQSNYGKERDLKAYAKAVSFLQGRGITTLAQFQDAVSGIKKRYRDTNKRIKQAEKQLHERKELVDQSEKYLEYRPVYVKYKHTKPRKQEEYYSQHTAELILYQTAERYLKEHLGNNRQLNLKGWKKEIVVLNAEKNHLYDKVYEMKAEVQEAETIQKLIKRKIGKTTFIVSLHFNMNSAENVQDKLRRIIISDCMTERKCQTDIATGI